MIFTRIQLVVRALALEALAAQAYGQNLIANPEFDTGVLTPSTSSYAIAAGNPIGTGNYRIETTPTTSNANFGQPGGNLGPHGGTGFMAVSGKATANSIVWQQSFTAAQLQINGIQGRFFTFTFWVAPGDDESTGGGNNPPAFSVSFIGNATTVNVTPSGTLSNTAGIYSQFTATWQRTGANTTLDLRLIDTVASFGGNNFILDSLVLVPESDTHVAGILVVGFGLVAWLKARFSAGTSK